METDIYKKCIETYNKLITDSENWRTKLKECIDFFDSTFEPTTFDREVKSQHITKNIYGKCLLLNNKKTEYYKFTYDIAGVIKKLETNKDKIPENFLDNFYEIFDTNIYENCCNCVSVVLYYTKYNDIDTLSNYLPNIVATLQNINKYLPDWILRVYLDRTFFETIKYWIDDDNDDNFNKIFDYMLAKKPILHSVTIPCDIIQMANCGISVPAEDVEQIISSIVTFSNMNITEREQLGLNGYNYVIKHHTYDTLATSFLDKII